MGYNSTIYVGQVIDLGKELYFQDCVRFELGKTPGMPDCFTQKFNGSILNTNSALTIDAYGNPFYICEPKALYEWLEQHGTNNSTWRATARAIRTYVQDTTRLMCVHAGC